MPFAPPVAALYGFSTGPFGLNRVEKRVLDATVLDDADLERARAILNDAASGLRLAEVPAALRGVAAAAAADLRPLLQSVAEAISEDLSSASVDHVFVGGQAALAGTGTLETEELHRLFEVLEERVTLSRLLAGSVSGERPVVRIGGENLLDELRPTSIVASAYGEDAPGTLGIIGPTRMDYPSALAAVKAVADQLQTTLRDLTDTDS